MKKCKYCMSEMDANATICPNCRKKQNKSLALILLLGIGLPVLIMALISIPIIVNISNEGETIKFRTKAQSYVRATMKQYTKELLDNNGEISNYNCYRIDEDGYVGSVEYVVYDDSYKTHIWLSNGKYYASGEGADIHVTKSSRQATTNCYR